MGQHHINMFPVDYMYVQDSLVLEVLFIWLRSPVDSLGNQVWYQFYILILSSYFKTHEQGIILLSHT